MTADQNLEYPQDLSGFKIAVVVLVAASNRLESLLLLIPGLKDALSNLEPGRVTRVED